MQWVGPNIGFYDSQLEVAFVVTSCLFLPVCRIHGVCVCDSAAYFHTHIDQQLEIFGLATNFEGKPLRSCDIVDVIEGYKGRGYGLSTDEELGQCMVCNNAHCMWGESKS